MSIEKLHPITGLEVAAINRVLLDMIDKNKTAMSDPESGFGCRARIGFTLRDSSRPALEFYFEFFSEFVVPSTPKDSEFGYTWEETTLRDGVKVCVIDKTKSNKVTSWVGEITSWEHFAHHYIVDEILRMKIERRLEEFRETLQQQENVLSQASELWANRNPGQSSIYVNRNYC